MGETITAENYLQHLFIDEVKNMLSCSGASGGTSGGTCDGENCNGDDCTCDNTDCECIVPGGCVPDENIATDDEVSDVLDDVFGL